MVRALMLVRGVAAAQHMHKGIRILIPSALCCKVRCAMPGSILEGAWVWGRVQQMGGLRTGLRPVHIVATSKMVSDYSGMMVQPHKVLRAAAHESWCMPLQEAASLCQALNQYACYSFCLGC